MTCVGGVWVASRPKVFAVENKLHIANEMPEANQMATPGEVIEDSGPSIPTGADMYLPLQDNYQDLSGNSRHLVVDSRWGATDDKYSITVTGGPNGQACHAWNSDGTMQSGFSCRIGGISPPIALIAPAGSGWTAIFWFYAGAWSTYIWTLGKYGTNYGNIGASYGTGRFRVYNLSAAVIIDYTVTPAYTWYLYSVVHDGSTTRFYVNDEATARDSGTGWETSSFNQHGSMVYNSNVNQAPDYRSVRWAHMGFYSRALTQQERTDYYNATSGA